MPTNNYPDIETRVRLNKALQILETFRGLDKSANPEKGAKEAGPSLGECVALLHIALGQTKDGDGLSGVELAQRMDVTEASTGRYTNKLALYDREKNPGREFITNQRDPLNERRKTLLLTKRGERFLSQIDKILGD